MEEKGLTEAGKDGEFSFRYVEWEVPVGHSQIAPQATTFIG